jgi:hypothetical protein
LSKVNVELKQLTCVKLNNKTKLKQALHRVCFLFILKTRNPTHK